MDHKYQIVFDLSNLNRTADYLVQKNIVARSMSSNPIHFVLAQLRQAVEKTVQSSPLQELVDDASKGVLYLVGGQSQVCYFLELQSSENRNIAAPGLVTVDTRYRDSDRYWRVECTTDKAEMNGVTVEPHFYSRLGVVPRNISLDEVPENAVTRGIEP
jgi:hypothetical protein